MRESKRTVKMRLPKDSTEAWLESQKPALRSVRHVAPPDDTYEAWVGRRVDESRGRKPGQDSSA